MLLVGYCEGIDSERGIAWRVADSLSLREVLGFAVTEHTPDHSSVSRTRRLFTLETHQAVFRWFVKVLGETGLVDAQTVAIDATTLEANAAMRSIRRRDDGRKYEEYLKGLAQAEAWKSPRGNSWHDWTGNGRRRYPTKSGQARATRMRASRR